ncbi:cytochrome c [Ramlibacter tataouinensis]|uniref:cytochrome c n=1 Tax=Ramlibacter tataouinensis TaxID=94132 RepID=UPI0022F39F9E|nr:cytochrome c [Ramlibacter tataouinensis]WBY01664.1 cytochrome c [Ramlibacter tataouinensis]
MNKLPLPDSEPRWRPIGIAASARRRVARQVLTRRALALLLAALPAFPGSAAHAQALPATRGALLYENHCGACHSEQMHWRAKRLARDWNSLREQVRHWQGEARLGWSEEDIDAVARHLNDTIYRFPVTQGVAQQR